MQENISISLQQQIFKIPFNSPNSMRYFFFLFFTLFYAVHPSQAQRLATLEVELTESPSFGFPVSVQLDQIAHLADSALQLLERVDGWLAPISFQIHRQGSDRDLYWMITPSSTAASKRIFELHQKQGTNSTSLLGIAMDERAIYIRRGAQDLWQYNHAVAYPPAGVDSAYARSGFVHPMWSPSGKALTRIQPPDHYHHYGLWNPWTSAEFEGQVIDFWNLKEKQGTVRYANTIEKIQGPVFAGYKVLHEHVVLKGEAPKVAMVETQGTSIFASPEEENVYLADITISLNAATDSPVLLKEYRYGSLGWRTTEKWDRYNSEVITSTGKNRAEADGSLATWCIVQGEIDDAYAGVIMMSSPTNYNHPEPLRIWPENMYDRGDMYANFAPTKNTDWEIEPGKNYVLNYRFLVCDRKLTAEEAENAWQNFANPPKVTIILD